MILLISRYRTHNTYLNIYILVEIYLSLPYYSIKTYFLYLNTFMHLLIHSERHIWSKYISVYIYYYIYIYIYIYCSSSCPTWRSSSAILLCKASICCCKAVFSPFIDVICCCNLEFSAF